MILLVEDNEDDVFLMQRALKLAGIGNPLHVVEDGEQAINFLGRKNEYAGREEHLDPLIVFLDLKMPRKSGFDVLKWLREQSDLPQPHVVVLSSSNAPQDWERVKELGATTYAIKPPTPELFSKLSTMLNLQWQPRPKPAVPAELLAIRSPQVQRQPQF